MPKSESQIVAERPANLLDNGVCIEAIGAFEIAVLEECEPRLIASQHVIGIVDRQRQFRHVFRKRHGFSETAASIFSLKMRFEKPQ